MKGLILKDLYMSVKYFRNYLFILILFLGLSFTGGDNLFLVFYPGLLAAMIPVNLLAYDERSHWDIYSLTLPVTRDMAVSAKYLLGLMLQGIIYLLTGAVQALRMVLSGGFHLESYLVLMALLWMVFLFSGSITLPFMFKLGVEKGRMAYYVMIGVICGSAAISGSIFGENLQATISFGAALILGCILAAAAYAGSWYLSNLFYRKRELH
jgi:hypothetical protein